MSINKQKLKDVKIIRPVYDKEGEIFIPSGFQHLSIEGNISMFEPNPSCKLTVVGQKHDAIATGELAIKDVNIKTRI